ncbi:hypothetical protein BGX26_008951 [Mortierella sp. AD094]|nr:hypothetical protein BGX26_008951 [Mortierella sp. AD094]
MRHYANHTFPATSSSDNSDSEDLYGGFETDDLPPSSDSEMISHPSDNEEHARSLSASPSPAYSAFRSRRSARASVVSGQDTDDENQALPSFSLSSQDFDQHLPSNRNRDSRVQDGFFLVEPSDLEPSSRPHSSLSHHSDLERPEDPMHFIYPSMALSPSSSYSPQHGDEAQEYETDKGSHSLREDSSHIHPAHDIPATIDSSLETILGEPKSTTLAQTEYQQPNLGEEPHKVHFKVNEEEEEGDEEIEEDKEDDEEIEEDKEASVYQVSTHDTTHLSKASVPSLDQTLAKEGSRNSQSIHKDQVLPDSDVMPLQPVADASSAEASDSSRTQQPPAVKSLLDLVSQDRQARVSTAPRSVSINTSWSLVNVITGCFGFLLMLLLAGYLSAEYYHRSVYPAHVVVSEVGYVEDSRVAVVHLSVYTYKLKREARRNRPPGFHVRVLGDNKPWSLEEAPSHSSAIFGEPIVDCAWGGWCVVYVPSLLRQPKNRKSPFLCSDTPYYLHIWFANGTRTSNAPPEIFTTLGEGKGKPSECVFRTSGLLKDNQEANDDAAEDDFLTFWKQQILEIAEKAALYQPHLSLPWANMRWDRLQPAIAEVQNMLSVVLAYYQRSTHMIVETVMQLKNQLVRVEDTVQERSDTALMRARRNAKKVRSHVSLKIRQVADQIQSIPDVRGKHQPPESMEHQIRVLKKTLEDQWKKLSLNNVVSKVDQLLADVENNLESLQNPKSAKERARSDELRRKAERLVKETETKLEQIFNSKFIRKINRNLQQGVDQFKTSPTGDKLVREAGALKKEAKRRWKNLQKQLRVVIDTMLAAMSRSGSVLIRNIHNETLASRMAGRAASLSASANSARPVTAPLSTHWHFYQQASFLTRGIHSSQPGLRNKPSSWGDLIPQPRPSSSSDSKTFGNIISRPQYKRFGQNPGNGGRGGRVPIFLDKRYQVAAGVVAVGAGGYYVTHLETVPVSGRRRFIDVSVSQEEAMAKEAYKQVMREYGRKLLPPNHPYTQYVERIAKRIVKAAGMENLEWEFHVIQSDEKNAFVLPGGKVFVFTGILPIAENENGLATVLGHEIAHQLARHSAEKLSFTKIALFVGVIVSLVFDPSWTMQSIMMDLGMMLPFSRKCETEADQIGLQLMAQACFDPRESTKMWVRMASQERGPSLAFLNTHPASKDRIHNMEKWMPEALETYNKSDCATTSAYADMFNKRNLAYW